jgi:hypothetical protein
MKRTYRYVTPTQVVTCDLGQGRSVTVPVIPGILKHPRPEQLPDLLARPDVAEKYTATALAKAAWPVLKHFPRPWLRDHLDRTRMRPSRRRALAFLLS